MKKLFALFFITIFAVQSFYTTGFTAWFYINRASIVKKHCINKNRPQLKCEGKCFLAQKIKETEKQQEEEQTPGLKEWVEIAPCSVAFFNYIISFEENSSANSFYHKNNYSFITEDDIFHPPLLSGSNQLNIIS